MSEVWYPKKQKQWSALDPQTAHPSFREPEVAQSSRQKAETNQTSNERIYVIDSADVEVTTTDTKAAISIQAALQAAIGVVLSIAIADSAKTDQITQELFQKASIKQKNNQLTVVKNSRNVRVTTTDTDLAVNVQLLLQLLLALLVKLEIL